MSKYVGSGAALAQLVPEQLHLLGACHQWQHQHQRKGWQKGSHPLLGARWGGRREIWG